MPADPEEMKCYLERVQDSDEESFTSIELCEIWNVGRKKVCSLVRQALKEKLVLVSKKNIQAIDGRIVRVPSYKFTERKKQNAGRRA